MTPFQQAWKATGRAEGGYVNDPNDSGGETNHGITVATARRHGYKGLMIDLPAHTALEIAKHEFWDGIGGDPLAALSLPVALEVFDTGINCGPAVAVRFLQRSLNALNRRGRDYRDQSVDGKMGPATLTALQLFLSFRKADGVKVLLRALNGLQLAFYVGLVEAREKDEEFLFGWINNRVVI